MAKLFVVAGAIFLYIKEKIVLRTVLKDNVASNFCVWRTLLFLSRICKTTCSILILNAWVVSNRGILLPRLVCNFGSHLNSTYFIGSDDIGTHLALGFLYQAYWVWLNLEVLKFQFSAEEFQNVLSVAQNERTADNLSLSEFGLAHSGFLPCLDHSSWFGVHRYDLDLGGLDCLLVIKLTFWLLLDEVEESSWVPSLAIKWIR